MSFANPWAIWAAALAAPVILAFLVRRWRRRRQVPSLLLYRRLAHQSSTRLHFATPRHLVALLLTLLALSALVLAALGPRGVDRVWRRYLVVLDTSASMDAREPLQEHSRWERALAQLGDFTGNVGPQDQVALITFGPEARLRTGWTDNPGALLAAASRLTPAGSAAASAGALLIADAMCQQPETTEIILVSDGGRLSIPRLSCPLRYVQVGKVASNLGITGLTVREADALGLHEIYLAIHNGSEQERSATVELELDGQIIDVLTEPVPGGSTLERLVRLPLPSGEILSARLEVEGEDALAADDQAFAVVRPGGRVSVLYQGDYPTTFLAEALRMHPRVDLTVSGPEETFETAIPFDLVVVDSSLESVRLPARHLLVLDANPDWFGLATSGRIPSPEIIRWSFDDPLFRFVNLDGVHLSGATATELPEGARSVMDTADGPLAFLFEHQGAEVLYFTFHPDSSDFPLRVAFVNLVANIVEWAQPVSGLEIPANLVTGGRLAARSGSRLEQVMAMEGGEGIGVVEAGEPVMGEGVYRLLDEDGLYRALVAVNLFSPEESSLVPTNRLRVGARSGWSEVERLAEFPWWILLLAALAFLLVEWLLPSLSGLEIKLGRRRGAPGSRRQAIRRSGRPPRSATSGGSTTPPPLAGPVLESGPFPSASPEAARGK
ncbi:MAG: VWA domain-containing protein [Bradymonadales bacterium]|nr:VWA domain-containing protein [Bradymonadales bacterium]